MVNRAVEKENMEASQCALAYPRPVVVVVE